MDRNSNNDEGKTNMGSDELSKKKHNIEIFLRERIEKATKQMYKIRNIIDWYIEDIQQLVQ